MTKTNAPIDTTRIQTQQDIARHILLPLWMAIPFTWKRKHYKRIWHQFVARLTRASQGATTLEEFVAEFSESFNIANQPLASLLFNVVVPDESKRIAKIIETANKILLAEYVRYLNDQRKQMSDDETCGVR